MQFSYLILCEMGVRHVKWAVYGSSIYRKLTEDFMAVRIKVTEECSLLKVLYISYIYYHAM